MSKKRLWTIYALSDPRDDQVRYVGWSFDPTKRLAAHLRQAKRGGTHKNHWLMELARLGVVPALAIIHTGSGDWRKAERRWIARFRAAGCRLTNATDGGDGTLGCYPSEETLAKMSASHKGLTHTQESKDKCRAAKLGVKKSAAHVAAMCKSRKGKIPVKATAAAAVRNRGKKQTAEHVAKRMAAHLGKPKKMHRRLKPKYIRAIRADGGKTSRRQLARRFHIGSQAIRDIQLRRHYADILD